MPESSPRSLTVVIPALNEEEAIGSTVTRCLSARDEIKRTAGLDDVKIIVVSDGSTDRTAEIARGFDEVEVIVFETNRGYGAAIKEGFRRGEGDLVGFLDADGTCDPRYFAEMCRVAVEDNAEIVLGSRMGADSKMPRIRRLGNRLYALLLGLMCGRSVSDTASGMRVLRREALPLLYPLPDRLQFTPAMSAKALTSGLRIVEIPMRYEERVGTSKLSVLADGFRFLNAIVEGVLCYRPERLFLMVFWLFLFVGASMALYPVEFYWHNRRIEEWMIYRFIVCFLLGSMGFFLLCAAVLANRMVFLGPKRRDGDSFAVNLFSHLFRGVPLAVFSALMLVGSLVLAWPGVVEYVTTRQITLHWSRIMVAAFGLMLLFQALVTAVMLRLVDLWKYQKAQPYSPEEAVGAEIPAVAGSGAH
jgi:glycosyltransferase involved in cell wall biosynthesis